MRPLLPLALEGRDTRDIEALPSYLSRLAASHGVTPGQLFIYLLNGYEGGRALGRALAAQPFAASVRPNATAERAIEILSRGRCEGKDQLRRSTFLHLTPALARSPRTYSSCLRWCPGCLYEQSLTCGTAYLKLSWFLEDVKACDIHRVVLRDTCPHCKRPPRAWSERPTFSRCSRCDGRLDIVAPCDRIELEPEAGAPDLIDLVEGIATRTAPFPSGSVNRYVDRVFAQAWASEREAALWEKLPRDECLRYAAPDEPITLPTARRIAFRLEVPILELLDAEQPTIRSFGFASESPLPPPLKPSHRTRAIDRTSLAESLVSILSSREEPGSLRQVARRLSVSVGAISYHCPDLVLQIVRRHAHFREVEAARKRSEAREAVRNAILNWPHSGRSMAKKAILRDLRRETGLPKNLLMAEIRAQWAASAT